MWNTGTRFLPRVSVTAWREAVSHARREVFAWKLPPAGPNHHHIGYWFLFHLNEGHSLKTVVIWPEIKVEKALRQEAVSSVDTLPRLTVALRGSTPLLDWDQPAASSSTYGQFLLLVAADVWSRWTAERYPR